MKRGHSAMLKMRPGIKLTTPPPPPSIRRVFPCSLFSSIELSRSPGRYSVRLRSHRRLGPARARRGRDRLSVRRRGARRADGPPRARLPRLDSARQRGGCPGRAGTGMLPPRRERRPRPRQDRRDRAGQGGLCRGRPQLLGHRAFASFPLSLHCATSEGLTLSPERALILPTRVFHCLPCVADRSHTLSLDQCNGEFYPSSPSDARKPRSLPVFPVSFRWREKLTLVTSVRSRPGVPGPGTGLVMAELLLLGKATSADISSLGP